MKARHHHLPQPLRPSVREPRAGDCRQVLRHGGVPAGVPLHQRDDAHARAERGRGHVLHGGARRLRRHALPRRTAGESLIHGSDIQYSTRGLCNYVFLRVMFI